MTWWISRVARSIAGRVHRKWQKTRDAERASRSGGGSCGRRVTQWWCLNECYRLAETRRAEQDNRGGLLQWTVRSSQPGTPADLHSAKLRYDRDMANENGIRHGERGDGNGWWGSHHSTISSFGVSLSHTRTMRTNAAKICQLSHRTFQGIQRRFVRNSGSGSRSIRRGWEEMTGYLAVRNHTYCMDLRNFGRSEWDQELGKIETVSWIFSMPTSKQT